MLSVLDFAPFVVKDMEASGPLGSLEKLVDHPHPLILHYIGEQRPKKWPVCR